MWRRLSSFWPTAPTSDREKAPARCCLHNFIAFEHHGVELWQHAYASCSQPGWLSTGQKEFAAKSLLLRALPFPEPTKDTRDCALLCCGARVSCLMHRPCRVPFLVPSQYGKTALLYAAENGHVAAMELLLACGADLNAMDGVRAPLGSFLTGGK